MTSITTAQFNALLVAYFFPMARILALLAVAPPFNNVGLSRRVRLILGLAIALAIAPALPPPPISEPSSGIALLILAQQIIIGYAMGFVMRLVFSAVDLSGVIISNLMGLGFATAYDPEGASQTPVVSEFFGVLALLTFLAINGHLMVIATLVQSFSALPIGNAGLSSGSWLNVANAGALIFSSGVFLALPVTVALLITNIALAILGRVAPQLNLMAIGFPITIVLGFATIAVSLSYLSAPLQKMFEFGLNSMLGYFAIR